MSFTHFCNDQHGAEEEFLGAEGGSEGQRRPVEAGVAPRSARLIAAHRAFHGAHAAGAVARAACGGAGGAGGGAGSDSEDDSDDDWSTVSSADDGAEDDDDDGEADVRLKPLGRTAERVSRRARWGVVPRRRLEIDFDDIGAGLLACAAQPEASRAALTREIEEYFSEPPAEADDGDGVRGGEDSGGDGGRDAVVCLSVRTGLDALLRALQLPRGTEVAMSAISIHDMVVVVEHHGLRPVPIDVDPDTLAMRVDHLSAALEDARSRIGLVIVAHVFGTRNALAPVAAVTRPRGILLVEDAAECFVGAGGDGWRGDADADAVLFSFGTIKTTTAFGGAVMRVRPAALRADVRRIEAGYAPRSRAFFAKRLLSYAALHAVSTPAAFGGFVRALNAVRGDGAHDAFITNSIRGFSGGELITLLRQRPSVPLLALMRRRLAPAAFDARYLAARVARGQLATQLLRDARGVHVPGQRAQHHAHWLFPVRVPDPEAVCAAVRAPSPAAPPAALLALTVSCVCVCVLPVCVRVRACVCCVVWRRRAWRRAST